MAFEPLEARFALAAGLVDVGSQPSGALTGKIVFTSAGHGWRWSDTLNRWATDRGNTSSLVEDFGNQDQLTYYVDYLHRAGATVAPMRPVGRQLNEVVLDNDSPSVTFTGSWSNNTAGQRWYDEDYGANVDAVKYRFASVNSTTETATATYTPNIPAPGLYPVYTWVAHSSNRTNQLYKIHHTGGTTEVRVDHRRVGNGWVYLGSYHFDSGSSVDSGSVQISNRSSFGGSVVIADAIRFGNGMGDLGWNNSGIGSGGASGFPREDESSILWTWRGLGQSTSFTSPSAILGTSNISAPLRMAEEMHADGTPYGTSVYIGFHSNATTGDPATATARGAIGLITTSPTPNQSDLARFMGRQINVDMRELDGQFEHDWSTRTTYTLTGSYGEISNTVANGKFDATMVEVGFHDTPTDNQLLRNSNVRRQLGRSTYEGTLEHFFNHFGSTTRPINVTVPSPPSNLSVTSPQSGSVVVRWNPGPSSSGGFSGVHGSPATGYRVYASVNGYGFDGGTFVSGATTSSLTLTGYDPNIAYYFKVVAENSGGQSTDSEVLTVNPNGGDRQVLIVNGFDRVARNQNFKQPYAFGGVTTDRVWERYGNSRDYTVPVQTAIQSARRGVRVDSTSNEAVIDGTVVLDDYEAVIWILGTESVVDQTFSATEQTLVNQFVAGGGNLLVTGADVGFDLDSGNNGRAFYRNTLGASFVANSSGSYVTSPVANGIFAGLANISFSNGSAFSSLDGQTYNVASADVLSPQAGSTAALQYVGSTGGVAAIQKAGTNGSGNVVTFGFPLETITAPAARSQVVERILGFFDVQPVNVQPILAAAILNELNVDPGGQDQPYEYVEVKGVPGSSTDNLYFVAFESDSNAGIADLVIPLGGRVFGSNGLLVIVSNQHSFSIPSATTVVATTAFDPDTLQTLENNSTTFALISSPTPIAQGQSYLGAVDGILELPAGATMLDSVGFSDGGAGDIIYGPTVAVTTPLPADPPSAATRFRGDNRPFSADAWYAGDIPTPRGTLIYSTAADRSTPNMPAGAALTPGAPNAPGSNATPVANADTYSVESGATLIVASGAGVLSNDTDPDGPLSVLTAVLVSPPTHGTLLFNGDGSFTYVSNGTLGVDSFTYFASDLEVNTAPVTVTINVEVDTNTPPTAFLSLSIDLASMFESGGTAIGTVTRTGSTTGDLVVMLRSNDTTEATVPASVTILDGQASATFAITAVDDAIIDGTQLVTITASAVGAIDATGTIDVLDNDAPSDTTQPTVTAVYVTGSAWSQAFIDAVDGGGPNAGNGLGYEVVSGSRSIPWANVNRIYVQFSEDIGSLTTADVALLGVNTADYGSLLTVVYNDVLNLATISLSGTLGFDKFRLGVSQFVTDLAGNQLDGDSTGSAGGNFDLRFDVLPGDVSGDRRVTTADLAPVSASFNRQPGQANYNFFADFNGDGRVTTADLTPISANFNRNLNSIVNDPGALSFVGGSGGALSVSSLDSLYSELGDDEEDQALGLLF